jgi:ABC-type uncharacterized transport system YnjBCD ATPase subunit
MALFGQVKTALRLDFRDLTFENFRDIQVPADALGVEYADEPG